MVFPYGQDDLLQKPQHIGSKAGLPSYSGKVNSYFLITKNPALKLLWKKTGRHMSLAAVAQGGQLQISFFYSRSKKTCCSLE